MFLDIACFITGEVYREEVENMFSCSDQYDVTIEITTLIDKSLLTESLYGCLSMHDLLREMGQAIVCDESKIPGNRSRLWTAKDVRHVLEKNKGTNAIQGISLNLSDCGIKKKVQVSPTTFSNMCHLRYLKIYGGGKQYDGEFGPRYLQVPENPFDISDELIYFHWDSYPLKYMPNFSPENLVGLIMRWSKLDKLWNEVELLDLEKLKKIDLSNSEHLTGIPSLSGAINLEIIDLQGCKNLVQIHLNLRNLCKLQILNLRHCYNLEKWEASESQEVPSSVPIGLDFSYCTGDRNRRILRNEVQGKFPEIWDVMECLYEIDLEGTGIEELPESIENLTGLTNLNLCSCPQIKFLPKSLCKLSRLATLNLKECSSLEELPRLPLNLTSLFINYCESLKSIQQLPSSLLMFDAADCTSMKTISSCEAAHIHNGQYFGGLLPMVWRFENCLDLDYNTRNHIIADTLDGRIYDGCACPFVDIVYPGNEIPKWFNNVSTDDGNLINFRLPLNWFKFTDSRVPFVVCIVGVLNNFDDDDHDKRMRAVLLKYNINFKTNTCDGHRHKYIGGLAKTCLQANNRNADHVFIMHNRDMSLDKQVLRQLIRPRGCLNLRNVDALQASFSICLMEGASVNLNIKNCGIRFIYDYDRTKVRQY
ncbi:probable WRKY transcription factor 19 isoform X3 [Ziziphus jujuba]|uniref:Probable WRKY transcription factor 19 isoform X3 n=1 Tax=Ziziphus jujuba TaxID=326968 RepID=A0ABM4A5S3_ZIZJJ|nr:probable WRKY transcription factor 19 isoform X3 [Ziziphus jujuba]